MMQVISDSGKDVMPMTVEELSELYYINKEIARIQKDIAELKEKNFYKKPIVSDMPKGSGGTDIMTEYADDMRTLETMLLYNLRKLQEKRKAAEDFLESIPDSELRLIMRLSLRLPDRNDPRIGHREGAYRGRGGLCQALCGAPEELSRRRRAAF